VGVVDVPLELFGVRLAQDGLLIGLRKLAEKEHIRRRVTDRAHCRNAVAGLPSIPAGFLNCGVELLYGHLIGSFANRFVDRAQQ
jgi:hypothetical protein